MAQNPESIAIMSEIKTMFKSEKLTGPNFNDWFRQLRIVLRVMKRLPVITTPMSPEPEDATDEAAWATYNATYERHNEVACLMLSGMTPELQKQFENKWPDEMITELRTMYEKQAGLELNDLIRELHECKHVAGTSVGTHVINMKSFFDRLERMNYPYHEHIAVSIVLNSLSSDFDEFTRNYNMHGMAKTLNELHAMLVEFEKSLPKKSVNNPVLAISGGGVQKKRKQPRAKGKAKKDGKNKQAVVYIPKPKHPLHQISLNPNSFPPLASSKVFLRPLLRRQPPP